jgi:hypothetical protein
LTGQGNLVSMTLKPLSHPYLDVIIDNDS